MSSIKELRNTFRILPGKLGGKGPHAEPTRKLEDNIKLGPKEINCEGVGLINLVKDSNQLRAMLNMIRNLYVPENTKKILDQPNTSKRTLFNGISWLGRHSRRLWTDKEQSRLKIFVLGSVIILALKCLGDGVINQNGSRYFSDVC